MNPVAQKRVRCPVCHRRFTQTANRKTHCSHRCSLAVATDSRRERSQAKRGTAQAVAEAMDALAVDGRAGELDDDDRRDEGPGVYLPTDAQIAAGCAVIQSRWTNREAEARSQWAVSSRLVLRRLILYRHNGRPVVVS